MLLPVIIISHLLIIVIFSGIRHLLGYGRSSSLDKIIQEGWKRRQPLLVPAKFGSFGLNGNNADNVFVLVVHYGFQNSKHIRKCNVKDVENLRRTYENRDCTFRELTSPKKEDLLGLLADRDKFLRFFGSEVVPSAFVLFVLSHGEENGTIWTDHPLGQSSGDDEKFITFTVDDILSRVAKWDGFEECMKLFNFGPCRGRFEEAINDNNNQNHQIQDIRTWPKMRNLYLFYSTVEGSLSNTDDNHGSWFVIAHCETLNNLDRDVSIILFLTMVKNRIHQNSQNILGEKNIGQTPITDTSTHDAIFVIYRSTQSYDGIPNLSEIITSTPFPSYACKSYEGWNISGLLANVLYYKDDHVDRMETALKKLGFKTSARKLSKDELKLSFKQVHESDFNVGCFVTCLFAPVIEETSILLDGKIFPISEILKCFYEPFNPKLNGKPFVLIIFHQEVKAKKKSGHDGPQVRKLVKPATRHSDFLVLIVNIEDENVVNRVIGELSGYAEQSNSCFQELLIPVLVTEKKHSVRYISTLSSGIYLPKLARAFTYRIFKLKISKRSPVKKIHFKGLFNECSETLTRKGILLLTSASAGLGKTSLLLVVAQKIEQRRDSKIVVLYKSLREISMYITDMPWDRDPIHVLEDITHNSRESLEILIREKRIFVFLDDYDQISESNQEKVRELVQALNEREVPFIIGARPHHAKQFQENVHTVEIEPMNERQQIEFLNALGIIDQAAKTLLRLIQNHDIRGNPFHLCSVLKCKVDLPITLNLYKIYEFLLRACAKKYLEQTNQSLENPEVEAHLNILQQLALCYVSEARPKVLDDLGQVKDYGIAIVLDGLVTFHHQIIAAFLIARKLLKDIEKFVSSDDVSWFFQIRHQESRKFLDSFYATALTGEEVERHRKFWLSVAKGTNSCEFLTLVCDENLINIFDLVKVPLTLHASIGLRFDPELLTRAIKNEAIAGALVAKFDITTLEEVLPEVFAEIEKHNAIDLTKSLNAQFPDLANLLKKHKLSVGFAAVRNDFSQLLVLMLEYGLTGLAENQNLLHFACMCGSVGCIQVLIRFGAQVAVCEGGSHDPLIVAITYGHLNAVKYLTENHFGGIRRNRKTLQIEESTDNMNPFHHAVSKGRLDIAKYLFTISPDLIRIPTADGKTPLQLIIQLENGEMLVWLVKDLKVDLSSLDLDPSNRFINEHVFMLNSDANARDSTRKTPLHYAAEKGGPELVQEIVDSGANVEAKDDDGWNPAHCAALGKQVLVVMKLLLSIQPLLARELTRDRQTVLHILIQNFKKHTSQSLFEIAKFLVKLAGVDVRMKDRLERKAVIIALEHSLDDSIVNLLMAADDDTSILGKQGSSCLHYAVMCNDLEAVRRWISLDRSLLMTKDQFGQTALHLAMKLRNQDIIQMLIDAGADLEATDNNQLTVLMFACRDGIRWDLIKMLLIEGVDLTKSDRAGNTAIIYVAQSGNRLLVRNFLDFGSNISVLIKLDEKGKSSLHRAVLSGEYYLSEELLKRGADANALDTEGNTPLHFAIKQDNERMVNILLGFKAFLTYKDRNGQNYLHQAMKISPNMVKLLHGKSSKLVAEADNDGNTSLHLAIKNCGGQHLREVVRWLVEEIRVDVNVTNNSGHTASQLALELNVANIDEITHILTTVAT